MSFARRGLAGLLGCAAALAAAGAGDTGDTRGDTSGWVDVVVTGTSAEAAARAVEGAGGRVGSSLPLIDGVVARLPEGSRLPGGLRVTPDYPVTFASQEPSPGVVVSNLRATIGLPPTGGEGDGATVALVDTGIAEVADLAGRVAAHIDVTGGGGGDGYGHGTFMAGLIAGSGASSGGAYQGVAPGARLVDVKVAAADGSTDLGSVLDGLQAIADRHRALGVDVVSLSLASGSPVPYQVDPLNQALRELWRAGLTVVVAAGNDGPAPGSVASPGNDPTLLTAGGLDEQATPVRDDDVVAPWSAHGPTTQGVAKPDLLAPATSVVGLRSPGSVVDAEHPQARIGEHHLRGSGTSMAAAVVSGAAADVLARNGKLRPDDVKQLLTATAYTAPGLADPLAAGRGGLDLGTALAVAGSRHGRGPGAGNSAAPGSPAKWKALADAFDAEDPVAAAQAWRALEPSARSWAARSWASLDGTTREWLARSWAARSWAGRDGADAEEWVARSWAARSWAGDGWAARSWAARSWAGEDWAARSWAARSWAARSWAGEDWAARSWASERWTARSWVAEW